MEADCCIVCDHSLGEDCVTSPADSLQRLMRLLQMVVEPVSDNHVKTCRTCENKMCQVEALLEELRVAYYETRKGHCSSAWTESVIEEDERLYYKQRLTVVQMETIGTQTEETRHTEVSKSRPLRKSTEPRQIKQETDAEYTTPGNSLTCPVCGDQVKTQAGFRRHLKNHGAETGLRPNTAHVKTEESADGEETGTPRRRGRPPAFKAEKKKEENNDSEKVDEDRTRADLLRNLQDHIYSELSAPSAGNLQHVEADDDGADYVPDDDEEYDVKQKGTPRRRYRKRAWSDGVVTGPPFECQTCQKVFKDIYGLDRHQKMVHNSNPTERFACDKCDVTFKWKQSLTAHQKVHMDARPSAEGGSDNADDSMVNDNEQNSTPRRKYRRTVKSDGVVSGPPFQCQTCQKTFKVRREFERHQEMVHNSNLTERFACDKCDVTFKWKQSLTAHQKRHMDASATGTDDNDVKLEQKKTPRGKYRKRGELGRPPFECETCKKIFKYRQVLERHQQMVHSDAFTERFPCDQCSLTFKWKQSLKAHMILHTDARPFACSLCPKAFRSSGTLRQHILSHEGTKLYQCHICDSRFTRSTRLRIHLRGHTGEQPYVCDQCGRGFADPQIFRRHMRDHNNDRPHVCGDCGKSFTMARYLSEHRKGHTGQREYLCSICGNAFANSGRLRRHMEVHGTKRYACTLCDKTYKYKEALANHMNLHKGLKPYVCSHCNRSFTHRSGLRQHALSHTAQPKPFKCGSCGKQFSTAAKVRRHAVLHGVKQGSKGGSQVIEVAVEDVSVDTLETHHETYDGTVVLEISNETEAYVPPVAAVEETNDMEVSAASESLLQVLTQQQQQANNPPARMQQASTPPSIQLTSSKLKAHLSRGQQATGEAVQEVTGETVQVIEYKQEVEEEEMAAVAGTQTIILQPANPGASSSLGQIYQVVGSGGSILYQIQQ